MLLERRYILVSGRTVSSEIELPIALSLEDGISVELDRSDEDELTMHLTRSLEREVLEVVQAAGRLQVLPDGSEEPVLAIRIKDDVLPERVVLADVTSALSFLTDVPFTVSSRLDAHRWVPEDEGDEAFLEAAGTSLVDSATQSRMAIRSFNGHVNAENLQLLMERQVGIRIYADALRSTFLPAQLRDLWRVMESAFNRTDVALIKLLVAYPPAIQLGFDEAELEQLIVLRGRASHAATRATASLRELAAVEQECAGRVARLKNLAERVILTKRSWGQPSIGVDELTPLQSFVGRDSIVIIQRPQPMSPTETSSEE